MKQAKFFAYCDLEVGDEVHLVGDGSLIYIIYDILTVHSFRQGTSTFEFQVVRPNYNNIIHVDREQIIYPIKK